MRILTHTVLPKEDGRMVKGILRGSLQLSYTLLKSLKWRENAILLNGQNVHVNAIVRAGDVVSVALSERTPREDLYRKNAAAPNIVYEDEDLLVLNKPAGVAMHPKADDAAAPSLAAMLTGYLGEGSVPHFVSRLDKGTSGLLIAAKSGYVHDRLRRALHSSELRREYRAVAVGQVTPPRGVIDAPIGRAEGSIIRRCVRETALQAAQNTKCCKRPNGSPSFACGPRQGARTSSASTWPTSATPLRATGSTVRRTKISLPVPLCTPMSCGSRSPSPDRIYTLQCPSRRTCSGY